MKHVKDMTQAELKNLHDELKVWIRNKGLYTVMRNNAHMLLPDINFAFKLNLGGGSYTDGKEVVVGIPELTWNMDKKTILSVTNALVGHESEHVWSSDFKVFTQFQKDVVKFYKDEYDFDVAPNLGAHFLNSTEDGRIEKRLINRFRGYKKHIQLLNSIFWKEQPANGENELLEFMYCITSICVSGLKKKDWDKFYDGTEQDLLLDEIRPLIMKAINNPTAKGCAEDTMEIVRKTAPYLIGLLQQEKEMQDLMDELMGDADYTTSNPQEDEDSQPGNSQSSHFLPEKKQKPQKGSGDGEGEEGEEGDDEEGEEGEGKGKGKKDKKDSDKDSKGKGSGDESDDSEESDGDEEGEGSGKSDKESDDEEEGKGSGDESDEDSEDGGDSKDSDDKSKNKDSQQSDSDSDNRNPGDDDSQEDNSQNLSTEEAEALMDAEIAKNQSDIDEDSQRMIEEGEREIEREEAKNRKANEYKGHLSEEDMRKLDKNVSFVNRNPEDYRSAPVPEDVRKNGQYLNKELRKILLNKQTFTSRNRRQGVLDTKSLWKVGVGDSKIFMKKGVPNDTSIAVNVLVDYSGSMTNSIDYRSNVTKLDMAIRAVATIEEGLRNLVPHRISFFTAGYGKVFHSTVKDFNQESSETLSWKRIPNMSSWANQDGYSIKVGALELQKRQERRRILIVLSDGLPTEPTQTKGQREVREAVRQARQDGMTVIAIAFGSEEEMKDNEEVYREMYQKGIIMVHPSEIHKELAKVMKNELSR